LRAKPWPATALLRVIHRIRQLNLDSSAAEHPSYMPEPSEMPTPLANIPWTDNLCPVRVALAPFGSSLHLNLQRPDILCVSLPDDDIVNTLINPART
jgi:hypothetical protein